MTNRRPHLLAAATAAVLLCLAASAVAEETAATPAALLEKGKAALAEKDYRTCYFSMKQLRETYPESPQVDDAFGVATYCHNRLYTWYRRYDRGDADAGIWRGSEQRYLFDWLLVYLAGDEFPETAANQMFLDYPFEIFTEFDAYAGTRPEVARWKLRAVTDNGKIKRITSGGAGRLPDGSFPPRAAKGSGGA